VRRILPLLALAALPVLAQQPAQPPAVGAKSFKEIALHPEREAPASAVSLNESRLSAEVSATVKEVAFDVGQVAPKGAVLIRLETRDHELALAKAQAALDLVKNQIANNFIKAPVAGTITKKNYEAGEQFALSRPVFSLLGANNFAIEVDVSESDIAKVSLNDPVEITLDAFGEDVKFAGLVKFIEPAETVIQDVIYYKVKINFDGRGKDIKSGMTANANITTAKKDNILIAPSRAVIKKNSNGKFVRLLIGQQITEVSVTIGLRGDNGLVEILTGLSEGDAVVTYIQQSK